MPFGFVLKVCCSMRVIDLLRLPWLSGKDVRVWGDEIGFVCHVEAGLTPANELTEELVQPRSCGVVAADPLNEIRVVERNHEGVLVGVAFLKSILIRRYGRVGPLGK